VCAAAAWSVAGCWNTRLDIKGSRTTQRLCCLILQMSLIGIIFFKDWSVYTWWWLLMKYVCMPCYCIAPNWGAVIVCLRGEHVSRTTHPVFTKFSCMLLYRWPWLVWRGVLIRHVLCFCGWQREIGCLWLPCFTAVFIFLDYACT